MAYFIQNNDLFFNLYILIIFLISYVLFSTNLIYSVIFLILTFILFSMVFILMGAELLGIFFILVYAGALCIFMLFILINFNLQLEREYITQQYFKFSLIIIFVLIFLFFNSKELPFIFLQNEYYDQFFLFVGNHDYFYFYDNFVWIDERNKIPSSPRSLYWQLRDYIWEFEIAGLKDVYWMNDFIGDLYYNKIKPYSDFYNNFEKLSLLLFGHYYFIFFLLGLILYVAMICSLFILLTL